MLLISSGHLRLKWMRTDGSESLSCQAAACHNLSARPPRMPREPDAN